VKLLPTFLPEVCQLSFKEIPASEQEKHLLEYHKIFYSQSHQQPETIAQLVWPHNRTVKDTGPYCCYHEYLCTNKDYCDKPFLDIIQPLNLTVQPFQR
jgi:hypothetical protein